MLVIVMHNNQEYLEHLNQVAINEKIRDVAVIRKDGIGTRLVGGTSDFIFTRGSMRDAYDKAFVAVVEGEQKTKQFLDRIGQDGFLERLNVKDKGFVCALPFHYIKNFSLESPPSTSPSKDSSIRISGLLKEDRILMNVRARDKKSAISELASVLQGAGETADYPLLLKDVLEREMVSTTGIGHEIAIPHARTDGVKELVIAMARVAEGLEFGSLDSKPVKLIFLIGTPKRGINDYLKILAHLTKLLQNGSFRDTLIKASHAGEIIEAFRKRE